MTNLNRFRDFHPSVHLQDFSGASKVFGDARLQLLWRRASPDFAKRCHESGEKVGFGYVNFDAHNYVLRSGVKNRLFSRFKKRRKNVA